MSERDFIIDIDISAGFSQIEVSMALFPISVEIKINSVGIKYIHQNSVSTKAGFALDSYKNAIQSYGMNSLLPETETDELIQQFSAFFKTANTPHRIIEIYHELDFDKEWLSYNWTKNK